MNPPYILKFSLWEIIIELIIDEKTCPYDGLPGFVSSDFPRLCPIEMYYQKIKSDF